MDFMRIYMISYDFIRLGHLSPQGCDLSPPSPILSCSFHAILFSRRSASGASAGKQSSEQATSNHAARRTRLTASGIQMPEAMNAQAVALFCVCYVEDAQGKTVSILLESFRGRVSFFCSQPCKNGFGTLVFCFQCSGAYGCFRS